MLTKWMSENLGEIMGKILPPLLLVRDFLLPQFTIEYFWMMYCRIDTFLPQNIFKIFSEDFYMQTLYGGESCETRSTEQLPGRGRRRGACSSCCHFGKDKVFTPAVSVGCVFLLFLMINQGWVSVFLTKLQRTMVKWILEVGSHFLFLIKMRNRAIFLD